MILFREGGGWQLWRFNLSWMSGDHSLKFPENSNNHPSPLYFMYFNCNLLRTQSFIRTHHSECKRTAMGTSSLHEVASRRSSASECKKQYHSDSAELHHSMTSKRALTCCYHREGAKVPNAQIQLEDLLAKQHPKDVLRRGRLLPAVAALSECLISARTVAASLLRIYTTSRHV